MKAVQTIFAAIRLFHGVGIEQFLKTTAAAESHKDRVPLILGRMAMGLIHKAEKYQFSLPPDLQDLATDFEKLEKK